MAVAVTQRIASDGVTNRMCVYRVFGITAADTVDLSADFANVTVAYFVPTSGAVAPAVAPITANTTATPAGALAKDDGYLIAYGAGLKQ